MASNTLYPMKFYPLFKHKIWGGSKIHDFFGIDYSPLPNCGELWALSGLKGNESIISNGFLADNNLNEVLEIYLDEILGEGVYARYGIFFPLLFKWIDANDNLSVQVHPDDILAHKRGLGMGKTEMWYIVQSDKDAKLISGFNRKISRVEYANRLRDKKLVEVLNSETVSPGDVFFIPAGRVHSIGKGILLAEIQQSSDTTYRIYDWDRTDSEGKTRRLHIAEAMDAIDFTPIECCAKTHYHGLLNHTVNLVNQPEFTTQLIHISDGLTKDYETLDSFVVYMCVEGHGEVHTDNTLESLSAGECMLLPATINKATLIPHGEMKVLETFILT